MAWTNSADTGSTASAVVTIPAETALSTISIPLRHTSPYLLLLAQAFLLLEAFSCPVRAPCLHTYQTLYKIHPFLYEAVGGVGRALLWLQLGLQVLKFECNTGPGKENLEISASESETRIVNPECIFESGKSPTTK